MKQKRAPSLAEPHSTIAPLLFSVNMKSIPTNFGCWDIGCQVKTFLRISSCYSVAVCNTDILHPSVAICANSREIQSNASFNSKVDSQEKSWVIPQQSDSLGREKDGRWWYEEGCCRWNDDVDLRSRRTEWCQALYQPGDIWPKSSPKLKGGESLNRL